MNQNKQHSQMYMLLYSSGMLCEHILGVSYPPKLNEALQASL